MNRRMHSSTGALRLNRLGLFGLIILALTLTVIPQRITKAAAGDFDPTFGVGGKVLIGPTPLSSVQGMALQPDGKIIITGHAIINNSSLDFGLARLNPDGSLDQSFGSAGGTAIDFSGAADFTSAVALQPNGKIVVAGLSVNNNNDQKVAVARCNANGSLDNSFGSGGTATAPVSGSLQVNGMTLQPDGKVIVVGYHSVGDPATSFQSELFLVRFNSNGSPDTTFGNSGLVLTHFSGDDGAFAAVVLGGGKILVAGAIGGASGLIRYNANGSLDNSFGAGGLVLEHVGILGGARAMAIQSDQKIVLAGDYFDGSAHMMVIRHNPDGTLDSSFGSNGVASGLFSDVFVFGQSVAIDPNGKIVIGGTVGSTGVTFNFALARYTRNGSLDNTFGTGGTLMTDLLGGDEALALAVQADGKIIQAGFSAGVSSINGDAALVRYDGGPLFDFCVQDDSGSNWLQFNSTSGAFQFTNCAGVTLAGTGTVTRVGGSITLQQNAGSSRLLAKVDTASKKATATVQILSTGRTYSITDRDITNNTCSCK